MKRSLDLTVAQGHDIPNAEKAFKMLKSSETSIKIDYIHAEKIQDLEPDTGTKLIPLKNTMKLHHLITEKMFTLKYRDLSCFCQNLAGRCDCHAPNVHSFKQKDDEKTDNQYILDEATGDMRAECREENVEDNSDNDIIGNDDEEHLISAEEDVQLESNIETQRNNGLHYQQRFVAKKALR